MKLINYLILSISFGLMIGCNEQTLQETINEVKSNEQTESRLTLKLTDAPFELDVLAKVEIEISKIDMRQDGEFKVLHEGFLNYDVLKLRGGLTETLVDTPIERGTIDLIRLYIESARITMKDGREFDMFVPSGAQTGLKLFLTPTLEVVTGQLSYELTLDFDISKSFIPLGSSKFANGITGFNFKPVIRVANNSVHGRIGGKVASNNCLDSIDGFEDEFALDMATVRAMRNGQAVASAASNAQGEFSLIGLDPGIYDIELSASKHNTQVFSVEVFVANETKTGLHILNGVCVEIKGSVQSDNATKEDEFDDYILVDASVKMYDSFGQLLQEVKTDSDGTFSFSSVFVGDYELNISAYDHQSQSISLNDFSKASDDVVALLVMNKVLE